MASKKTRSQISKNVEESNVKNLDSHSPEKTKMTLNEGLLLVSQHVDTEISSMTDEEKAKFFDYLYKREKFTCVMAYTKYKKFK